MRIFTLITFSLLFSALVNAQNWQTDLEKAKEIANNENRKIVLVFQGSDWCAPCIKLEQNIWSSEEFKNYAKDHFVMLLADFPRKKKNQLPKEQQEKNNFLAEKYNPQGFFPLIVVLDKGGEVLGSTGYKNISPKEYIDLLNSF
ncbi:MAG: thioredoxin family protein [Bacteroidales bacterium]|nr:thioredoxin family protein [Bacteroidales bacterium]